MMILLNEFETKTGGHLDILDVTGDVAATVVESGIQSGTALVFSPHTTCCVLIAASPSKLAIFLEETLHLLAPENGYYAHDDLQIRTENLVEDEPANGHAHIAHVVLGKASECVPIQHGRLVLGASQRIVLVELDSSRPRRYCVQVVGE